MDLFGKQPTKLISTASSSSIFISSSLSLTAFSSSLLSVLALAGLGLDETASPDVTDLRLPQQGILRLRERRVTALGNRSSFGLTELGRTRVVESQMIKSTEEWDLRTMDFTVLSGLVTEGGFRDS